MMVVSQTAEARWTKALNWSSGGVGHTFLRSRAFTLHGGKVKIEYTIDAGYVEINGTPSCDLALFTVLGSGYGYCYTDDGVEGDTYGFSFGRMPRGKYRVLGDSWDGDWTLTVWESR